MWPLFSWHHLAWKHVSLSRLEGGVMFVFTGRREVNLEFRGVCLAHAGRHKEAKPWEPTNSASTSSDKTWDDLEKDAVASFPAQHLIWGAVLTSPVYIPLTLHFRWRIWALIPFKERLVISSPSNVRTLFWQITKKECSVCLRYVMTCTYALDVSWTMTEPILFPSSRTTAHVPLKRTWRGSRPQTCRYK